MATAAPSPLASSREKTNGNKLSRLLIDGGTTVLRNIFDRHHPPANLASGLNANYSILNNLFRRRVLNKHQWEKLFPPTGGTPDSNTFDITLLFLLLTNACGLSPPASGWHAKPSPGDSSLEANLARVKFFRNELYGHVTSTGVDATSFSSFWQEISTALQSLGLDQAEIDRLKAEQGGEQDYLDALIEWADREEDIKTQLTDIRQTQLRLSKTVEDSTLKMEELRQSLSKTQDVVDEAVEIELKGQQEMKAAQSRLERVCEYQSKTSQAVDEIRESMQEVKQEVKSLTQKRNEQADEVLRTLVKSEFKGDIELHAKKFQEGTREWIFKSIEDWLDDQSSPHRVMVISGNPGMGKTVVSAVVSQRMQSAGRLSGSHFCQHDNSRYRDPRLMLQSLACHLCQAIPNYKDALVEKLSRNLGKDLNNMDVKELFALLFKEPLSTVQDPGRNTLIIIDGLDESEYQGHNELLHVISNHFSMLPVWIRILITTRPERSIIDALRHLEPIELEQKQEENLNDIRTLFEIQLSHKISEEHKDILLKELVKKSEGLFIYAYFIVDFIQKNVSILTPDQLESVLPSGISSVYLSYFKRLENELCKELNADEEHFLRFLCALTAAREPLPVEFIAKILNPGGKSLTAQRKVKKAISCISTLLPVREGRLHFFHKSIKDWLIGSSPYDKQHDFTVDEKKGHNVLSELCASELDSIKRKGVHDRQFTNTETYALHHGIQHMLKVNDHDWAGKSRTKSVKAEKIYKYATDLELIYGKLLVKSTNTIEDLYSYHIENSSLLSEERDFVVTSLVSLLKKHSYVLVDQPHLFFQCLINEEIPELSSSAAVILESLTPKKAYMKYLDREEQKGAEKARFYCLDKIVCFDVSPDMKYLVCECRDETIYLWSLRTGNKKWVQPTLTTKKVFYSGYPDNSAYRDGGHSLSYYRSVTFHPNGKFVLPGTLRYGYSILTGDKEDLFPDSDCVFSNFVFCKEKKEILTDCQNKPDMLALWNTEDGKKVLDIVGPWVVEILSFTISEDGSVVAISYVNGQIILFDRDRRQLQTIHFTESLEASCGLMHLTSDKNTLVCGFLGITFLGHHDSYKGFFHGPPKFAISRTYHQCYHEPYFDHLHPFRLWPCDSSGTLDLKDFITQDKSCYWLREADKVIPGSFLYAGSYIRFDDKSALVGSPASKYITMLNTDVAFDSRNGGEVKEIACSLKGDTIYSTTSEFFKDSLDSSTKVTALRMSNREELNTIELPGSVSIFPTRDGVVLLKDDGAELWTFDMSKFLRYLPEVTRFDGHHFSISEERIARFYSNSSELIVFRSDPIGNRLWQRFVIQFLDVTSARSCRIISSLEIFLDRNEQLLSVPVCSNPSQVLLCTASEEVTVSSWKNGVILWEETCWTDSARVITAIKPQMLFSPKSELVVTWNTLDEGQGLHILNADSGETLHVFLGDQTDVAIVDCKFLDDESLVCCSEDNFLRLYNLEAGDLLSVLDIGEQPFCLGACLYQPLVAIGLSGARTKFIHVQLPKETKKKERLVSFLFNSFLGTEIN